MAVEALSDEPVDLLERALDALRSCPAPVGQQTRRLGALAHAVGQLNGIYLAHLAQAEEDLLARSEGFRDSSDLLTSTADRQTARRLAVVPGLLDAVADGRLDKDAGELLAKAWGAVPADQRNPYAAEQLIRRAAEWDLNTLRAAIAMFLAAIAPDVTVESLADAAQRAELTLTQVGSELRLTGFCDALTGEWLRDLLDAVAASQRTPGDDRPLRQRHMDALLSCLRSAAASPAVPKTDGQPVSLVVLTTPADLHASADPGHCHVDPADAFADLLGGDHHHAAGPADDPAADDVTDLDDHAGDVDPLGTADQPGGRREEPSTDPRGLDGLWGDPPGTGKEPEAGADEGCAGDRDCSARDGCGPSPRHCHPDGTQGRRWTARTRGGLPLGPVTLTRLCCSAKIVQLLLDGDGLPVGSRESDRQLNRHDRRALEHRAGYRCENTGCGRPAAGCIAHHVVPWAQGGATCLANSALLCLWCHHLLHDQGRVLTLRNGARIGPHGWVRPPDRADLTASRVA